MIAQWISTMALGVYPPMSRWVYALTFLRSTSQGVDAGSCSFTGSLPLWNVVFGFSGASIVKLYTCEYYEIAGCCFDVLKLPFVVSGFAE